jgi:uncharacterized damage-inducible protein DinB
MPDDVLKAALDATGNHLSKCLDGLPETAMDARAAPDGMTAREILEHLCECYDAYSVISEGKEYAWGSYKAPSHQTAALLENWRESRDKAVAKGLASKEPKAREDAVHYIAIHDAYHVGQLCLIRLAAEPGWDAYSIYQG